MQITRVELRNIKNHARAEWTFLPGLIAICGPNGSGKTTILEGIAWALFDQLEYKREDFVKRGEKKGYVTVSFISDLDEREYTVQRDTTGTYIVYDAVTQVRLAEQKQQVLPWLCQHIGVDPGCDLASLFRSTIGVPQGTFTTDFALRPAERKSVFDRTLKVDEYRNASDQLRSTVRRLEAQTSEAQLAIAAAEGELRAYEKTVSDLDLIRARQSNLTEQLEAARQAQATLTRELEDMDELQRRYESQVATAERLDVKSRLTRDKLSSAREAAEQAKTAASLVEAARSGYDAYVEAAAHLSGFEEQRTGRDRLREDLLAIERQRIEVLSRLEHNLSLVNEAERGRLELSSLSASIAEQSRLEARIAELREGRGTRLGLERSLIRIDEELAHLRKRYSEIARETDMATSKRELATRLPAIESERAKLDTEISRVEAGRANLEVKLAFCERLDHELAYLKGEQQRTLDELKELESLEIVEAEVAALAAKHQQQTERLAQLRAEVERDTTMIEGLEKGQICPLLTEKCLNLQPGESLDRRFREGIQSRVEEIERIERVIPDLAGKLKQAQESLVQLARAPKLQSESSRIDNAIRRQEAQLSEIRTEITGRDELGGELVRLRSRRSTIDNDLREAMEAQQVLARADFLSSEVEAVKERGRLMREEREELAARIRDLLTLEANLDELETELRQLGNPRGRAETIASQLERADEWRRVISKAEIDAAEIASQLNAVTASLKMYESLDSDLASASHKRSTNERDYRAFIANEQLASACGRREQDVRATAEDVALTEKGLSDAIIERNRLAGYYDATRHVRTRLYLEESHRRTTQLATQLEHANQETERLETLLAQLEQVRVQLQIRLGERDRLMKLTEMATFVRRTLQEATPYITEAYLFSISHEANQLYREITGRQDVTLEWNREYEITLEEEGQQRPFGNLSGGEQMAAALAIRLALLKEFSDMSLAFFDEPTTNLDEERRRNLAQQIGRIKHFKQLFVVSHDDSFEAYTDQVIVLAEEQQAAV